jgi:hypothetical protein
MTASGSGAPSLREEHDTTTPMREIRTGILRFKDRLFSCHSRFRVPLAIRFRSAQSVEQDVQIAEHGEKERVVKSNMVGNHALDDGQDGAAHDGHIQDA